MAEIAVIDYKLCEPEYCNQDAICAASTECINKALRQLTTTEKPFIDRTICRACFECLDKCSRNAIRKSLA